MFPGSCDGGVLKKNFKCGSDYSVVVPDAVVSAGLPPVVEIACKISRKFQRRCRRKNRCRAKSLVLVRSVKKLCDR